MASFRRKQGKCLQSNRKKNPLTNNDIRGIGDHY